MRVIVFGSREWTNATVVWSALNQLGPGPHTIIHGGCRGADRLAANVARGLGHATIEVSANWERFGKSAGPKRNALIVSLGADLAIGFGVSGRGSQDMLRKLRAAGINISTYEMEAM